MATSCSHEEVPRPKALSGQNLEYNLSNTSEERADCESVCKVRIRSCTPVTCLRGTSPPLQCYSWGILLIILLLSVLSKII